MKRSELRKIIKEELLKEGSYITNLSGLQKEISKTKAKPSSLEVLVKIGNKEYYINYAEEKDGRFIIYTA